MYSANSRVAAWIILALLSCENGLAQPTEANAEYQHKPSSHFIAQLTDEDPEVRRRAVYILGQLKASPDIAVPALAKALTDGQMETRWYAIDALGKFGPAALPAVPAMIKALASKLNDETVRRRGARSLGRIGPAAVAAVKPLTEVLQSDDALCRIAAAEALWRISRHDRSLEVLSRELSSTEPEVAFAAAHALGEISEAEDQVIPPLVGALSHADPDVRQAAVAALVRIGSPALSPICSAFASLNPEHQPGAATALGMIIDAQRRKVIYNDASSRQDFTSTAAPLIRVVFPVLIEGMQGNDVATQGACTLALAKGGSLGLRQLLVALSSASGEGRAAAVRALVRVETYLPRQRPLPQNVQLVHDRLLAPLTTALALQHAETQKAAVRLFAAMEIPHADEQAIAHLQQALQTGDLSTRRWANQALQRVRKAEQ